MTMELSHHVARSSCKLRSLSADRRAPINAFEQHGKLRRRQCSCRASRRGRPNKAPLLKPLGKQTSALAVPPQHLDEAPWRPAKDKGLPAERFAGKLVLHQRRQAVEPFTHVSKTCRQPDT